MTFEIINHPAGTTFARAYSGFKDEYGVPVTNLANWLFVARLKASPEDSDAAALISVETPAWVINSTDGEAGFSISAEALAGVLAPGETGYLAVLAQTPSGFVGQIDEAIFCLYVSAAGSISQP